MTEITLLASVLRVWCSVFVVSLTSWFNGLQHNDRDLIASCFKREVPQVMFYFATSTRITHHIPELFFHCHIINLKLAR